MIGPLHPLDSFRKCTKYLALLAIGAGILERHESVKAQTAVPSSSLAAPVQLEYLVPSECAGQSHFVDRVRGRSERIQLEPIAKMRLEVTIQGRENTWTGRVSFIESNEEPLSREITAQSCDEVIDGLALVTVMVLDPDAIQHSSSGSSPPTPALTPRPVASAPSTSPDKQPVPRVQQQPELPSHFGFGADAVLSAVSGPTPGLMWGWGVSTHVDWVRPSPWSPHLRLSWIRFVQDAYLARGGTANFSMNEVYVAICPYTARYRDLRAYPCAVGGYGTLTAKGTRTFVPQTETHTWAEADLAVEFAWNPIWHLELFLAPAVGLPLKRYSFGFSPYDFHTVPPVIFSGVAGLGLQFE